MRVRPFLIGQKGRKMLHLIYGNRSKGFPLNLALSVFALNLAACCLITPHYAQAEAPATTPVAPSPGLLTTEGMITMVEADGTVIIMSTEKKGTVVYVRPETKVTRNGLPATIKGLKAGDRASAKHGAGGAASELSDQGK